MLQAGIALLKGNLGHTGAYGALLVLIATAYLAQDKKINEMSLELGETRATVKYQQQALNTLTERCFEEN